MDAWEILQKSVDGLRNPSEKSHDFNPMIYSAELFYHLKPTGAGLVEECRRDLLVSGGFRKNGGYP